MEGWSIFHFLHCDPYCEYEEECLYSNFFGGEKYFSSVEEKGSSLGIINGEWDVVYIYYFIRSTLVNSNFYLRILDINLRYNDSGVHLKPILVLSGWILSKMNSALLTEMKYDSIIGDSPGVLDFCLENEVVSMILKIDEYRSEREKVIFSFYSVNDSSLGEKLFEKRWLFSKIKTIEGARKIYYEMAFTISKRCNIFRDTLLEKSKPLLPMKYVSFVLMKIVI